MRPLNCFLTSGQSASCPKATLSLLKSRQQFMDSQCQEFLASSPASSRTQAQSTLAVTRDKSKGGVKAKEKSLITDTAVHNPGPQKEDADAQHEGAVICAQLRYPCPQAGFVCCRSRLRQTAGAMLVRPERRERLQRSKVRKASKLEARKGRVKPNSQPLQVHQSSLQPD